MKVLFIGCVEFSYQLLKTVHEQTEAEIVGIVSKEHSTFNADFKSLIPFAIENNIPYLNFLNNEQLSEWLSCLEYDVIYCFGWSHLLPLNIIKTAKLGAIGYHPALLPENRGRHPIIWALALGLEKTGSTFFFMDEGADSGDIVSQVKVRIEKHDTAMDLYKKLMDVAKKQVIQFTKELMQGSLTPIPQDHQKANYWRKRTKQDGLIDWRMTSESIYNLVRALSEPYVGAHCCYNDHDYKIWKVSIEDMNKFNVKQNIEPGKVIKVFQNKNSFIVKTGDGIIEVLQHEFKNLPKEGEYLI
ncbi:formyltransferase family protein [Aeribacillus sp. FSL K6-2848]|uniref:formyltransferase family protein n=1 Tax=Aeribacillus sp. FSL K6-2848 TaxID=2954612 RepID=UPI0030FB63B8